MNQLSMNLLILIKDQSLRALLKTNKFKKYNIYEIVYFKGT